MKTRIEALERQDFNKNVAIDVADLINQKKIIQNKLIQVDQSINYLNEKLEDTKVHEKLEATNEGNHTLKICKFDRSDFCRERDNCTYFHGDRVCDKFRVSGVCTKQKCFERHPKRCIYFEKGECQWGSRYKYLHQANNDTNDKDPDESIEESLESTLAKDVHDLQQSISSSLK